MKKILIILFLISIILISGCTRFLPQACKADLRICPDETSVGRDPSSKNCEEFYPCSTLNQNNFNIYYSFGVGEINILDTKNNIYIKDMVCDPPKQYNVKLSDSEIKTIYDAVLKYQLYSLNEDLSCKEISCPIVVPNPTSTLKIITEDKIIKTIKASYYESPDTQRFYNVENIIREIISQKETELNIEQPRCGYL